MLSQIIIATLAAKYSYCICFVFGLIFLYQIFRIKAWNRKYFYALAMASTAVLIMAIYPIPQGISDNMWNVPTAVSILLEGDTDIDEFCSLPSRYPACEQEPFINSNTVAGAHYNSFPLGISLVALPVISLSTFLGVTDIAYLEWIAVWTLLFALMVVFFLLVHTFTHSNKISAVLTFLFLFATANLYTMRNMLATHGGVELMLLLSLFFLQKADDKKDWRWGAWSALPLAMAYLIRPTSGLFLVVFGLYILFFFRKAFLYFIELTLCILVPFFLWSEQLYHTMLPPYYQATRLSLEHVQVAFWGQMVSPNRGLFIFTPLFVFSLYGLVIAYKQKQKLFLAIGFCLVGYIAALASFPHWWGGSSYGPRLFTDVIPLFMVLLIPVMQRIFQQRKMWLTSCFILMSAVSVAIAIQPFISSTVWNWNFVPVSIDEHPERVWDWGDMQMLAAIRNGEL